MVITQLTTVKWYDLCLQIIQTQTCYPLNFNNLNHKGFFFFNSMMTSKFSNEIEVTDSQWWLINIWVILEFLPFKFTTFKLSLKDLSLQIPWSLEQSSTYMYMFCKLSYYWKLEFCNIVYLGPLTGEEWGLPKVLLLGGDNPVWAAGGTGLIFPASSCLCFTFGELGGDWDVLKNIQINHMYM